MSVVKTAFRGGIWLSAFSLVSQTISWCATLVVARLLSPSDYGLMDMATILTAYVQIFYDVGIGAAIVQRESVDNNELSSLFWALAFWGCLLGSLSFVLAYPTVLLFGEPRLFHLTQATSALFVLGTCFVVPGTLMKRQLRFKAIGAITSTSVIVACASMVAMAYCGAGVWTLILGYIVKSLVALILVFVVSGWRPRLHFRRSEAAPYLRFGLPVAGGASMRYFYMRGATFFGGRAFPATVFGHYTLAQNLASMPSDKLLWLINVVAYPVFSRLQNSDADFRRFFLRLSQFIAFVVMPIYVGGFFLAGDLVPWVLGNKWEPCVIPFRMLLAAFMVANLCSTSNLANTAQGRPHWGLWFEGVAAATMTVGFYLAAASGSIVYLAVPWLALYVPTNLVYMSVSMRKIGISARVLLKGYLSPALALFFMLLVLILHRQLFRNTFPSVPTAGPLYVLSAILLAAGWYGGYMLLVERGFVTEIIRVARNR